MPDLNHLWQRFLLASSLLVGLAIGVAATVFGYSNLATVNVHLSVLHLDGVPLWTVAVVPITLLLIAGTLYHWIDGLHHFTEHMRHRRRVHELEAELAKLRAHLDQVLEMPGHREPALEPSRRAPKVSLPAADMATADLAMAGIEPIDDTPDDADKVEKPTTDVSADAHLDSKPATERRRRGRLFGEAKIDAEPALKPTNGLDSEPVLPVKAE